METYTIESADGDPVDPGLLRELWDLLSEDEDLDIGVSLIDRPPAPGKQGAVPVALEIVAAATPLGTAFAGVLKHWISAHKVSVKMRHKGDSVELSAGNIADLERLIAKLKS